MIDDMKKYFFYAILLSVWTLTACSNDDDSGVPESVPLYQKLGVSYNVGQKTTNVGANFNTNNSEGANVKLSGSSSIFINGKAPDFMNTGIYFYTYSFSGLEGVTFKFNRRQGVVYTNVASLNDVRPIAIPESFTTVSLKGSTVLTWVGEPLGENEYATVSINYKGGVNNVYEYNKDKQSISISFAGNATAGKATLSLSRVHKLPLQESDGNAGGQLEVSYVDSKEVTIE